MRNIIIPNYGGFEFKDTLGLRTAGKVYLFLPDVKK